MREKSVLVAILCCLLIMLTMIDLGLFLTNRILVKNHTVELQQIQVQINGRDARVQQLIGQLKATKTIGEVQKILQGVS